MGSQFQEKDRPKNPLKLPSRDRKTQKNEWSEADISPGLRHG